MYLYVVALILLVNQDLAVSWSVLYRFVQVYPGALNNFFNSPWIYAIFHLFVYSVVGLTFAGLTTNDRARQQFLEENPDLLAYANEAIVCFADKKRTIVGACILMVILISFLILGILLLTVLFFRIKSTK